MTRNEKHVKHPFLWFFLAVQAVFLLWLVLGVSKGASTPTHCADAHVCDTARQVGAAIGAGVIIALWAAVDIILGIGYAVVHVSRKDKR